MTESGPAERSARRILAVDAALLMLIVVGVHLALASRGGPEAFPVWYVTLNWSAVGLTLAAGVLALWLPDPALRIVSLIAVAAYIAVVLSFPAAVPAEGISRIPWTLSASGAAAAAALVAQGRSLAFVTVGIGFVTGMGYRVVFGGLDLDGIVNDGQALLTGVVICVVGGHMLAVGRRLDAAAADAATAAAREAAGRGRLAARSRAAALVHDEVLAVLSLAASGLPMPAGRLAAEAVSAAAMVSDLADDEIDTLASFLTELADEARRAGATVAIRDEGDPVSASPPGPNDVESRRAILGATRQALANSRVHAPGARLNVDVTAGAAGIVVVVDDDGPGFDPASVAEDRLGIRRSILERMARIPGGGADVVSAPGRGTTVRVTWTVEPGGEPSRPPRESMRRGFIAIAAVFVTTQTAAAVLSSWTAPTSWPLQVGVLVVVLIAAEVLRRARGLVPTRRGTTLVVVIAAVGFLIGACLVFVAMDVPFSYGYAWFAVAFAFLLVSVALRRRTGAALAGVGAIAVGVVLVGIAVAAPAGQIVQIAARPVVLVGLAVALLVVLERMRRRIDALHRETIDLARRESWTAAARAELGARAGDLTRTAAPLLARIASGGVPTESERREYARCEGELRDALRAGILVREPLATAVASARERGVDVLLLDDGGTRDDESDARILAWMAAAVDESTVRVVGRLLPPGRAERASVTVDGRHRLFAGEVTLP